MPQALRERFGLLPGTEVEFVPGKEGLKLRASERGGDEATAFDLWLMKAAGSAQTGQTTDEIMAVTRGED